MARHKRQFSEKIKGGHMENEDWWYLVFDDEANRLFVEHEWSHVDVWGKKRPNSGSREYSLEEFLSGKHGQVHEELRHLIKSLFPEKAANG